MCSSKFFTEQIRTTIAWPSGSPSRLLKEEGVHPPQYSGQPNVKMVPAQVGGTVPLQISPGNLFRPPGESVQSSASSVSGDPGIPRPPTREDLIFLLKGCDALGG